MFWICCDDQTNRLSFFFSIVGTHTACLHKGTKRQNLTRTSFTINIIYTQTLPTNSWGYNVTYLFSWAKKMLCP